MPEAAQQPDTAPDDSAASAPIAPLWHTLLLAVVILSVSVVGLQMRSHTAALETHHSRKYLATLAYEWVLAAAVLWGITLRRVPLRVLLGEWQSNRKAWLSDLGLGLAFWVWSAVVLAAVGYLLTLAHLRLPASTVASLAPAHLGELLLFLVLSLSAGFCEELLFRGYLQQQCTRLARGRVWVGVLASSLLFGLAHLYEGAAGVISITLFGVMFSLLAIRRRSLRPAMIAHGWHDALSGFILFLLQHTHALA